MAQPLSSSARSLSSPSFTLANCASRRAYVNVAPTRQTSRTRRNGPWADARCQEQGYERSKANTCIPR